MPRVARGLRLLGSLIHISLINSKVEWGSYVPGSNQININKTAKNGVRVENLIHEALHVLFEKQSLYPHIKGHPRTKALWEHEEELVKGLTPGIISLMTDNGVDLSPLEKLIK